MAKAKGIEVKAKEKAADEVFPPSPQVERVIDVIQAHPEGIRLLEIGNELGVDWRGITKVVKTLVDAGQVEKMDDVYYPSAEQKEGI